MGMRSGWGQLVVGGALLLMAGSASAVNLLTNPHFNTNTTGWSPEPGGNVTVTFSTNDSNGSGASGSASVTNTSPNNSDGLGIYQCITVTAGASYTYGGKIFYPTTGQSGTGPMYINGNWMDGANCTGTMIIQTPSLTVNAPDDTWHTLTGGSVTAPAGAVSLRFQAFPSKALANGSLTGLFDDLYFDDGTVAPAAAASVPTLSEWGLVLTSALLGLVAVAWRRKSRA